jgi:hypothetical protein
MTARDQVLGHVLEILDELPGATAWQVSVKLPSAAVPAHLLPMGPDRPCATTGETLKLLQVLEKAGRARSVPDPHGAQWYRVGPAGHGVE